MKINLHFFTIEIYKNNKAIAMSSNKHQSDIQNRLCAYITAIDKTHPTAEEFAAGVKSMLR
jgi:hypothetical protein